MFPYDSWLTRIELFTHDGRIESRGFYFVFAFITPYWFLDPVDRKEIEKKSLKKVNKKEEKLDQIEIHIVSPI